MLLRVVKAVIILLPVSRCLGLFPQYLLVVLIVKFSLNLVIVD